MSDNSGTSNCPGDKFFSDADVAEDLNQNDLFMVGNANSDFPMQEMKILMIKDDITIRWTTFKIISKTIPARNHEP